MFLSRPPRRARRARPQLHVIMVFVVAKKTKETGYKAETGYTYFAQKPFENTNRKTDKSKSEGSVFFEIRRSLLRGVAQIQIVILAL